MMKHTRLCEMSDEQQGDKTKAVKGAVFAILLLFTFGLAMIFSFGMPYSDTLAGTNSSDNLRSESGDAIGRHCGGIGTIPDDWCGCIWGAVYFQDDLEHALEGISVEIHYGGDYVWDVTSSGYQEEFPYFAESADRLGASEGDTLTLVARWGQYQTSLNIIAAPDESGEQRVDLVFPFSRPPTTPAPPVPTATPNPEGWPLIRYDSASSLFYPYSTTHPITNTFVQVWSLPGAFIELFAVGTGDVNGDGWLEIVAIDGQRLRVFSHDGEELWNRDIPGTTSHYNTGNLKLAMLADVTGNGHPEIVVLRKIADTVAVSYTYDGQGNLLPSWGRSTGTTSVAADGYLEPGDLLDGKRAFIPIGSNYAATPRGAMMIDVTTGTPLWTYLAGCAIKGSIADMNGDGIREIVNAQWSAVHNDTSGCGLGWNWNTCTDDWYLWVVLIDENGREIFTWRPPGHPSGGELNNRIVDLDKNGEKEIVVVEAHFPVAWHPGTSRIFVLNRNGDVLDSYIGDNNVEWRLYAVADVNADGYDELILDRSPGIQIFDRFLDPVAENPDYPFVRALNDINGDGQVEILAVDSTDQSLTMLNSKLQPLWRDETFDNVRNVIVSDLSNDGVNEILAYSRTELRIYEHEGEPLLTPIPPTPPIPLERRTLFLINESRLETLYADEPQELMVLHQFTSALQTLAMHTAVSGTIVHLEDCPDVAAAYDAWLPDPRSPVTDVAQSNSQANAVADAIFSLIEGYTEADPTYWNIVLVGDDRIIPFRRVYDASPSYFHEGTYNPLVVSTTTGAAMVENTILTDDFYGDLIPNGVPIPVAYVADHPVGRLVERPSEMLAVVEAFLARDGMIFADPALVIGHDLVTDAATAERAILLSDGIPTDFLIGDGWTTSEFYQALLETPHNFCAINTHARHNAYAAPSGAGLRAWQAITASHPASGTVAVSLGCHAGLNVPPDYGMAEAVDFPEAFAGRGVGYIANTGWGIGDRSDLAYSEELMAYLTAYLTQEVSATLGTALVSSKQAYIANRGFLDGIDEKVLLQFTLYGLPMYRVYSGANTVAASSASESSSPILNSAEAEDPDLTWVTVWYQPNEDSFQPHSSPDGVYYTLDDEYQVGHNSPLQPRRYVEPNVSGGVLHGAVFRGGIYEDTTDFDPVVSAATIITSGVPSEGEVEAGNWYPPIPFQVLNVHPSLENREESFIVQFGQFRPADNTLRLYSRMTFDLYYSLSEDFTPPTVTVSHYEYQGLLWVSVVTTDTSGIHTALVSHSADDGHWRSIRMIREAGTDTWYALLPISDDLEFIVQVVDGAGNVTIADNNGLYYAIDDPIAGLTAVSDAPTALGSTTTLSATITAGSNVSYTWDLGDDRRMGTIVYRAMGYGAVVTYTYPALGVYTAVVTASNLINTLTATTMITIAEDKPIAGLKAVNDSPTTLGSATTLTATITTGSNVSYTWDLGDKGITGTGTVISHTYTSVGVYTAAVTASNRTNWLIATTNIVIDKRRVYLPLVLRYWLITKRL